MGGLRRLGGLGRLGEWECEPKPANAWSWVCGGDCGTSGTSGTGETGGTSGTGETGGTGGDLFFSNYILLIVK